jgi:hypothetical protein
MQLGDLPLPLQLSKLFPWGPAKSKLPGCLAAIPQQIQPLLVISKVQIQPIHVVQKSPRCRCVHFLGWVSKSWHPVQTTQVDRVEKGELIACVLEDQTSWRRVSPLAAAEGRILYA